MDKLTTVIIFLAVLIFAVTCLWWRKPVTGHGKLSQKLCLFNALGWFIVILSMPGSGHPPLFVIIGGLFWLLNLLLLPVVATVLWLSHKDDEESVPYLVTASAYVLANVAVLFIWPLVSLMR